MEVVFLRASGVSVAEVVRLTDVSPNNYRAYLRDFQQGGINGLKSAPTSDFAWDVDGRVADSMETKSGNARRPIAKYGDDRISEVAQQRLSRIDRCIRHAIPKADSSQRKGGLQA